MKTTSLLSAALAACLVAWSLTGCSLFSPSGITPHAYVLMPVQNQPLSPTSESTNSAIGLKLVKLPGYLSTKGFAMRRGGNEIVYLEGAEWAERLDNALQRVLAANLSALLPSNQVLLSLWDPGAVSVQVEVTVEQFDVDSKGEGVLIASWRVLSPANAVLSSGRFSATRKGQPPDTNTAAAVSAMSQLGGDLAEKLAQVIKQSRTPPS